MPRERLLRISNYNLKYECVTQMELVLTDRAPKKAVFLTPTAIISI